jgi:iron(III) transport system substrate-binding protein
MKAFFRFCTIVVLITLLVGCAPAAAPTAAPEAVKPMEDAKPTEAKPASPQEEWLKANQLGDYTTDKQDWDAIEAAAKKEGTVLVYANSSKIAKAAEIWAEKYPDIKLEGFDLGGDDVLLKTRSEQEAGAFTGDVWFSSGGPDIVGELMPKKYLWKFIPDSLAAVVPENLATPLLTARFGVRILAYNSELNKNGCPVTNLWQLTDADWKGKVFIEDPLNDASTLGILLTVVSHPDEMKAAYKELYGKDPTLDSDTPDAGWLWLKKLAQNAPVPESGGDEVDAAFATPGMKDSYLAFTSYSNYPDVEDGKLAFEPCWEAKPIMGVQTQAYVGIINQAPHPNAAKLFIRFVLNEGADPWMKTGNYLPRTDVESPEGAKTFTEIAKMTWSFDDKYVYENITQARDFYLVNLGK